VELLAVVESVEFNLWCEERGGFGRALDLVRFLRGEPELVEKVLERGVE
jgi:hypothetical protein